MAAPTIGSPAGFRSIETWDLVRGVLDWRLWAFLGLQDIRQRYRRSMLGPLWLTMGLGVTVIGIGLLYSKIIKADPSAFIPYFSLSLLIWNFISSCLNESTTLFLSAQNVISSVRVPYTSFILRSIVRNLIVAAHGVVVVVLAFAWFRVPVGPVAIVSIAGLAVICANLYWIMLVIALMCARFRDMAQIVVYGIQIVFFLTPIIWMPSAVRPNSPYIAYNPLAQLIAVIRTPILYHTFPINAFLFSLAMLVVGSAAAFFFFQRSRRFLVYWI